MKKLTITLTLILAALAALTASAQMKTPEAKPLKPTYRKVVVIPVEDFQVLTSLANDYKQTVIYHPATPEITVNIQKQIDAYLKDLSSRVKLDSVKVEGK